MPQQLNTPPVVGLSSRRKEAIIAWLRAYPALSGLTSVPLLWNEATDVIPPGTGGLIISSFAKVCSVGSPPNNLEPKPLYLNSKTPICYEILLRLTVVSKSSSNMAESVALDFVDILSRFMDSAAKESNIPLKYFLEGEEIIEHFKVYPMGKFNLPMEKRPQPTPIGQPEDGCAKVTIDRRIQFVGPIGRC